MDYDESLEKDLQKISVNFYARSALEMNQSCVVQNKTLNKINLYESILDLKDSNWDQSNVQDERNHAYTILVTHCILFLMITFCQYCSISFKLPYMFICTVLMHLPTSVACLVLIVNHFGMIAKDIDELRIY